MSMNQCPQCGDVYDTDYQMHEVDGVMVCDKCWEDETADNIGGGVKEKKQ